MSIYIRGSKMVQIYEPPFGETTVSSLLLVRGPKDKTQSFGDLTPDLTPPKKKQNSLSRAP